MGVAQVTISCNKLITASDCLYPMGASVKILFLIVSWVIMEKYYYLCKTISKE